MHFGQTLLLALLLPAVCSATQPAPSLTQIADEINEGNGDAVEPTLLELHQREPRNAEVMTQLARIEYLRAVSGSAQINGMPPMNWDQGRMDAAETWIREAVGVDPKHANAWVVYGQIKYARSQLDESLKMLERAEALDPSNVKLRLRKGATLRSLAQYRGDNSLLQTSAAEYQLAIEGKIDDGNERLAASELGEIFSTLGQSDKALLYLDGALTTAQGSEKAFLLERRARVNLEEGEVDPALADIQSSLQIMDFGVGRNTLADVLLVKAGLAMRGGAPTQAAPTLAKVIETGVEPASRLPLLASKPGTFPAIYALLTPEMKASGANRAVDQVLGNSAGFVARDDLKRLHALSVDFNAVVPGYGTILHRAIFADNVEAVRALLEMGADKGLRHPNGRTLLETTLVGTSEKRREIRRLVLAKVGKPPGWKDPGVDLPLKNHWYTADRAIGRDGDMLKVLPAGQPVLAGGDCWFQDKPDQCLSFYTGPGVYFGTVALPMARLEDLEALREIPAPKEVTIKQKSAE